MKLLTTLVTLAYPFLVCFSLSSGHPAGATALLGALLALKTHSALRRNKRSAPLSLCVAALVASLALAIGLLVPASSLYYPAVMNAFLLALFGSSFIIPPTIIERFALAAEGELSSHARAYCRKVCAAWVVFFAVNLLVSLDSTRRPLSWWTLHNGFLSYVAIGTLFGGEYLIRRRVMKRAAMSVALCIAAAVAALPSCQAEDALTPQQLRTQLRTPRPFRAGFTEQRFVSILTAPLESKGEIECVPGSGLVWHVTHPVSKTSLITPSGLTMIEEGGARREISDRANISAALLSLMSGEIDSASDNFTLTTSGTPRAWILTLTPKDTLVAEVIDRIVVSGRDRPDSLEIIHANKDRVLTTFSEPTPLSPSDEARAQAMLHEAS
jgi:uncharacterized membrane protein/outer membrane lipoprotein-sorting protein